MDKEEAMKILKDFHDKSALFSVRTALDTIIPELCESEDEAIRKAILELVKQSSEILDKQNQNNMINWLEKQGEKKPIVNVPPREVILSIWDLGNEWKELTNGCISTEYGTQLDYIQKHWQESTYYLTVKQGEQKPQRMISAEAKEALYDKPTDEEMKELLRTEYEKGRADGIAEMKKHIDIMDNDNIDDFAYQCAYDLSKDWLYENASWDDVQIACKLGAKWYEEHHKVRWSDEDERMIDNIIFELEENQENISGVGYKIDWLKQLKQRIGG